MASSSNSPLEALRGDAERILELVFETGNASNWGKMLSAPLECAVLRGDEAMMQKLVEAGASMGASVHAAVENGSEEMMHYLLTHGGSVHHRDASKNTPLHTAARIGDRELARSLVLRGADLNVQSDEDGTPLFCAAKGGHLGVVEDLLAAGADVTRRCRGLERPLEVAARHGHVDILRALIESGSDVNFGGLDGTTALKSAVFSPDLEVIDVLAEAGANMEPRDVMGYTPLHLVVRQDDRRLGAARALLRHGVDVNVLGTKFIRGQTPLHSAVHSAASDPRFSTAPEVIDALLRWGADETILDAEGKAPVDFLLDAVFNGPHDPQMIERVRKLLVNASADRAWRRRGYLVLCRAYPERVKVQVYSGQSDAGMARRTRSSARLARAEAGTGSAGGATGGGVFLTGMGGGRDPLAARVVGLEKDDIFRTIVGYL
eukprot:g7541.t1